MYQYTEATMYQYYYTGSNGKTDDCVQKHGCRHPH